MELRTKNYYAGDYQQQFSSQVSQPKCPDGLCLSRLVVGHRRTFLETAAPADPTYSRYWQLRQAQIGALSKSLSA
jgi:hypothetical protein